MLLSPNFTLNEMTKSQEAKRMGLSNKPKDDEVEALRRLCLNILQPIRDEWKRPVRVTSGFRSFDLNVIIGGSRSSQHMKGEAADIEIPGVSNFELAKWIAASDLPFDQLILEFHDPTEGPNDGWVHVSHAARGQQRQMVLTAMREGGKTIYVPGLIYG